MGKRAEKPAAKQSKSPKFAAKQSESPKTDTKTKSNNEVSELKKLVEYSKEEYLHWKINWKPLTIRWWFQNQQKLAKIQATSSQQRLTTCNSIPDVTALFLAFRLNTENQLPM